MIRIFLSIVISFLITNWIYSELVLLIPHFETVAVNVYRTFRIPTHDNWSFFSTETARANTEGFVERSLEASENYMNTCVQDLESLLDNEMGSFVKSIPDTNLNATKKPLHSVGVGIGDVPEFSTQAFLEGAEIFSNGINAFQHRQ